MNASCPVCATPFHGRADKKYCSDQCRALANYKKKMLTQEALISINQILRRNRTILKTLCPHGKATVRKEIMLGMGFLPSYFTSFFVTSTKQVYYICYDFAFSPLRQDNVEKALIVSRQSFKNDLNPWRFLPRKN